MISCRWFRRQVSYGHFLLADGTGMRSNVGDVAADSSEHAVPACCLRAVFVNNAGNSKLTWGFKVWKVGCGGKILASESSAWKSPNQRTPLDLPSRGDLDTRQESTRRTEAGLVIEPRSSTWAPSDGVQHCVCSYGTIQGMRNRKGGVLEQLSRLALRAIKAKL